MTDCNSRGVRMIEILISRHITMRFVKYVSYNDFYLGPKNSVLPPLPLPSPVLEHEILKFSEFCEFLGIWISVILILCSCFKGRFFKFSY